MRLYYPQYYVSLYTYTLSKLSIPQIGFLSYAHIKKPSCPWLLFVLQSRDWIWKVKPQMESIISKVNP